MQHTSVLARLATRFASHPENIATEALLHVLSSSPEARSALVDAVREVASLPELGIVSFRSQAADADDTIPDLVGVDGDGVEVLLVENKFWAGLTRAQPVTYLARMQRPGAVLLFVAPSLRIGHLWPELLARCAAGGLTLSDVAGRLSERRAARLLGGQTLAATSWRHLLRRILERVEAAGQVSVASDVLQLQGLCDAMDSQAFLPLTSEELTGTLGLRVLQFSELTDAIAAILIAEKLASKEGLRATASKGWYGQYLRLGGYGCLLAFSAKRWAELGVGPLWLRIVGPSWQPVPTLGSALQTMLPDAGVTQLDDGTLVPIRLAPGLERDALVDRAVAQVRAIAMALGRVPAPVSLPATLLPPEDDGTGDT